MMRSALGFGLALAMIGLATVGVSEGQEGLTKRDGRGPVTVAVTLLASPAVGAPVKARIVLDTHSVGLDAIAFEQVVALSGPDGAEVAPTAVEQTAGSGHHRSAVVLFPPVAKAGPIRVLVKDVGGVAERAFAWEVR